jgi:hypothetical protein
LGWMLDKTNSQSSSKTVTGLIVAFCLRNWLSELLV